MEVDQSTNNGKRSPGENDPERDSKRQKLDPELHQHVLPPSHSLLGIPLPQAKEGEALVFLETDVGISEYVGRGVGKIEGIIKQRFTDFLVNEIDQDGNVIHLKNIDMPSSQSKSPTASTNVAGQENDDEQNEAEAIVTTSAEQVVQTVEPVEAQAQEPLEDEEPWPERFTTTLSKFLSSELIAQVKQMFIEGPEPPRVSDSGWGGRVAKSEAGEPSTSTVGQDDPGDSEKPEQNQRGRGGKGRQNGRKADTRKVLSDPMDSKGQRTALHQAIRELFGGKLDSETDSTSSASDDGARIVIRWARQGGRGGGGRGGRGGRGAGRGERTPRGTYPSYIHFTMQKTNRDTQDALGHLARTLHVNIKDLSVAGTKDKRGVTVQRVALKRHSKTVEDVWKSANGIGRRSHQDAISQRGDRGIRLADFRYRKAWLELGMLKGNSFVITLRNVKVDSAETLDASMNTLKYKGFINYYGMQRFGTASVPTHAIGLALLQSDWHKAVSLILQKRPGEHPDVVVAREAWLIDQDLDKALELMPRRVVAERCILESYRKQKGETRNAMGALSTIPRNLRLMYVHAYQSYVWNAVVSERIRTYGTDKPVVGDLVLEATSKDGMDVDDEPGVEEGDNDEGTGDGDGASSKGPRKKRPYVPPRIKTLTESDLDKYTIFDVVMPLPGTDVAYPGGDLGKRYREFLTMDGLDPDNFVRKQKEYTLHGSYRAILHLPKSLSWKVLRYTDPDVALAQADEDKLLGFDPPVITEDGKFMALQVEIALGTASYATMALREITKTDTSSQYQTGLTQASEDQKFRGYEGEEKVVES